MNAIGGEVEQPEVRELSASFRGELVRPGDPAYDERRRVWNGSIDRHPALMWEVGELMHQWENLSELLES